MNSFVVNLYPKPNQLATSQNLTVAGTSVQFANTFSALTNAIFITVQTAPVWITFDGSTPSSTNGHLLPTNYNGWFSKDSIIAAKWLRSTGTSAFVSASEFTN